MQPRGHCRNRQTSDCMCSPHVHRLIQCCYCVSSINFNTPALLLVSKRRTMQRRCAHSQHKNKTGSQQRI